MTWRCRFDSSTTSKSTMPSVPTPAAARYSSAGCRARRRRPPAPWRSSAASARSSDVRDDQVPAVARTSSLVSSAAGSTSGGNAMFSAPCWWCTLFSAAATLGSAAIFPAALPTSAVDGVPEARHPRRGPPPAPRSGPRARRRGASSSRPAPTARVAAGRQAGATSRSRSPQTTRVGTRTLAATAHSDSPRHQLRSIAFAVRSNASYAQGCTSCGRPSRRRPRRGGARGRGLGRRSAAAPRFSCGRGWSSRRAPRGRAAPRARAAPRGSAAGPTPSRVRPAVGHRGRHERERTHELGPSGHHHHRDRTAERVAQQVHRTAAPGEEAQQRVGVPTGV